MLNVKYGITILFYIKQSRKNDKKIESRKWGEQYLKFGILESSLNMCPNTMYYGTLPLNTIKLW